MTRLRSSLALAAAAALLLAGCSSANDGLSEQYRAGDNQNYISGDGSVTEFNDTERGDPIEFAGIAENGGPLSSEDYAGQVLVVNFWYAECPPCRAEAPDLEQLYQDHGDAGVQFIGVNTRNQADTALAFARNFGVTYPSIMDANDGAVQLAFAGSVAPNAVPTTLVLNRDHQVTARVLGQVTEPSILDALIRDALAET